MVRGIEFFLGTELIKLESFDPNLTLLNWLRYEKRLTGTKEGCAEGDCGACTVVIRNLLKTETETPENLAVNACLILVATLHGTQVLTVEHISEDRDGLHPVQKNLIHHHAAQCGFCTPGFVMSLYSAYENGLAPSLDDVDDILAGNLCRCTGYGPIISAALDGQNFNRDSPCQTAQCNVGLSGDQGQVSIRYSAEGDVDDRLFFAPTKIAELIELLAKFPEATLLAGGTDVGVWINKDLKREAVIIYLGLVVSLDNISETQDSLTFGAMVTYTQATDALLRCYPSMQGYIRRIGSVQIRNAGTIVGNIANGSPVGDMPPALLAMGAVLLIRGNDTVRRLPLNEFFLGYRQSALLAGEFIETVEIPKLKPSESFYVHKVSKRLDQDISAISMAIWVDLDGEYIKNVRLAYGGMSEIPKRAIATENFLKKRDWTAETMQAALSSLEKDFSPISDFRASSAYRLKVARNLLIRSYLESKGQSLIQVRDVQPA